MPDCTPIRALPTQARRVSAPDGLPPLRDVIARHGLRARKRLGQNFILDLNLTRRIARAAGDLSGCDVLEIGPGPGGLTRALLIEGARRVVAVERDERCLAALDEIAAAYPGRLRVVKADALSFDPEPAFSPPVRIISNLPYNIGTPLLVGWLTPPVWPPFWSSLTLLFQKEVAERIVAPPGSRSYGRLAVLAQWRCSTEMLFDLAPSAFTPPPKVTSSLVQLHPLAQPHFPADATSLQRVTAAAFGQRRKMLRSALKPLLGDVSETLERIGIDPTRRAETLSLEEFCLISQLPRI